MAVQIGVIIHRPLCETLFAPADRARLEGLGKVAWTQAEKPLTVPQAAELLKDCAVGVGSWGTPFPNAELLAACPKLKLWEHVAGTVKHMFGPHLEGRDLQIASCAPAIADSVAEFAVGELIVGLRKIPENAAANRAGPAPKPPGYRTVGTSTIGIIGASQVGRRVLRLLKPFGPTLLLYDPYVSEKEAAELGARKVADVAGMCRACDAVTLHTPDLPETRHILGARELQALPDHGVVVNTARGNCLDEAALIAELRKGRLFAFLDVSTPEPAAADSPLRRLPNVFYTSHHAGGPDTRLGRQAAEDIAAFLSGGKPKMAVTKEMLSRLA